MHIRKTIIASRAARVGTVLAMAAGIVVFTATPSFALAAALSQAKGPAAGTNKITVTGTGTAFATGTTVEFSTVSCPSFYTTTSSTVVASPLVTVNSGTSLTVTVPAVAVAAYYVCAYVGSGVGTSAQSAATGTAAYTVSAALTSLVPSPLTGASSGSNTTTVTDAATAFGTGTTVEFNTATCPATYATPSTTVFTATPATFTQGATALVVPVPNTLSAAVPYFVCAYTGNTVGTSALITGTLTASYAVSLALNPNKGPAAGTNTIVATDASAPFSGTTSVEFNSGACPTTYPAIATGVVAGTVTGFTTTTLTITVPALTAAVYFVCAYSGTTVNTSALLSGQAAAGYTSQAAGVLTLNPPHGPIEGGTAITATDSSAAFGATTAVELQTQACSVTYATVAGTSVIARTATSTALAPTILNITMPALPATTYSVCAYTGTTVGTSALISASASRVYTVTGTLTLSTYNGPSGGGNSITATTSSGLFLAGTAVLFEADATVPCAAIYSGGGALAAGVRLLSPTRLAITVPGGTTGSTGYNVCAYAGTGSGALIAETTAGYLVAAQATITSVSPSSGSAQGGTLITVTGTALTGIVSATVGGVPLINWVSTNGGAAFTATTPPHAAGGPFSIAVVTPGGTATKVSAFTYSNGIVVTPNKASNNASIDIDVQGVGFGSITFTATGTNGANPTSATGHVFLVRGTYNPTALVAGYKANDGLLECADVLIISDTELVCTMHLAGEASRQAFRASALSLTTTANIAQGSATLTTTTASSFTAADIGLTVTGTGIPDATTIVSVVSATEVLLSQKATAPISSGAALFSPPRPTPASDNTIDLTTSATTVTNAAAVFLATDIGRTITGTGIQPGTTIAAVAGDLKSVTLSAPATTSTAGTLAVTIGNPAVPNGTYTITVVSSGAVGAGGANYSQSIISSGSTFTVSDY